MSTWSRYLEPDGRWRFRRERLHLPSGLALGGAALQRDPWQRELWEIVDAPHTQVACIVGHRGVAKTTLGGAIGIERTVLEVDHRVVAVANDADQARLLYDAAAGFVKRDPVLTSVCSCYPGGGRIVNRHTGSRLEILTSDAVSAYGLGGQRTLFIFDEIWGLQRRDLLDALLSAIPKVPGSQLLALTNAGFKNTPAWELWRLCRSSEDPAFRAWDSQERGVWPSWMDPAERDRQRQLLPPSVYSRLFENQWTAGGGDFLTEEEIRACVDESLDPHALRFPAQHRSYLGIDLGLRHDRSVVTALHKSREVAIVSHIETWFGTPQHPVSLEDVLAHVLMLGRKIPRIGRGYLDPWQGIALLERAHRAGLRKLEEYTFTAQRIQMLSQTLWHAFKSRTIRIPPHAHLIEELVGARVIEKSYGWRVDHQGGGFSDHLISLGLALVASVGDAGAPIVDDTRWEPELARFLARVRDTRPFGFGKRSGLVVHPIRPTGMEDLEACVRVAQILRKTDRVSPQEFDTLRRHYAGRLRRTTPAHQVRALDGGWLDRELGSVEDFVFNHSGEQRPATTQETT